MSKVDVETKLKDAGIKTKWWVKTTRYVDLHNNRTRIGGKSYSTSYRTQGQRERGLLIWRESSRISTARTVIWPPCTLIDYRRCGEVRKLLTYRTPFSCYPNFESNQHATPTNIVKKSYGRTANAKLAHQGKIEQLCTAKNLCLLLRFG